MSARRIPPVARGAFAASPVLLAVLLLSTSLAAPSWSQDWKGRGRISGVVESSEGEPIQGAKVHIRFRGQEDVGPKAVKTDKKGRWAYMGLSSSPYTLIIEADGFVPAEMQIRVNEYAQAPPPPLEVTLRPVGETEAGGESERLMGLIEHGNQLMQDGQFTEARGKFEEVLQSVEDPAQRWPIELAVANTYLNAEQPGEARTRYQALLAGAQEPADQVQIHKSIARAFYMEDDIDASMASLETALALAPEEVSTLKLIVDTLLAAGREAEAEPYMARLPATEKIDPNVLLNLGITAYNSGEMDTALEKFQTVIDSYPDNASAFYYLGLVQMGQEKNADAMASFEKVLELAPDHPNAAEVQQFLEYLGSL
ncbi:MAG: tetratricopeptide repeat protein [Holophagales bacterium]|nr:tetratricopeptide repeat protein [Holophagales bacterium]